MTLVPGRHLFLSKCFLSSGFQQQVHETQGNTALLLKGLEGATKKSEINISCGGLYHHQKVSSVSKCKEFKPSILKLYVL